MVCLRSSAKAGEHECKLPFCYRAPCISVPCDEGEGSGACLDIFVAKSRKSLNNAVLRRSQLGAGVQHLGVTVPLGGGRMPRSLSAPHEPQNPFLHCQTARWRVHEFRKCFEVDSSISSRRNDEFQTPSTKTLTSILSTQALSTRSS